MSILKKRKLPYGLSDFKRVKTENWYYIDKTKFIEKIENEQSFVFFLRPRRFGKSLTIAMLCAYYDINFKDEFDDIFKDTYILNNQTCLKNSFYIMKFDFSGVDITDYKNSFKNDLFMIMQSFVKRYKLDFEIILTNNPIDTFKSLLNYCSEKNLPIYILIDEYDNFVNKLLVENIEEYKSLVTTSDAFYKQFFTTLKVGTSNNNSAIKKMFFTGVSPLALYDVTSGSNIGKNISMEKDFNDMVGVTDKELDNLIEYYELTHKKDTIIKRCKKWYNNYKFNKNIKHTIYNSDMILYYFDAQIRNDEEPQNLIDVNVRTDYSKLKFLVYTNKRLNGNFNLMNDLIQDKQVTITNIKDNFSAFEMLESDNFSSLLFSLGFVTIEEYRTSLNLKVPNQTIKKILADFINSGYKDINFNLSLQKFNNLLSDFAYDKSLEVFRYLNEQAKIQSVVRDYIDGESFIKGFLTAYLSLNPYYEAITEYEVNKGFVDIILNPSMEEIPYGALIELKYISKSNFTDKLLDTKIQEAKKQLNSYDISQAKCLRGDSFVKIILVYKGWELVYVEEYKKIS